LVKRVFDRRGRSTWDEKPRAREDLRLTERRRSDRRVRGERRVSERRQVDTWADDPSKDCRRVAERRQLIRRSGRDRRQDEAAKPKTYVHELVNTSGKSIQTLAPDSILRDAVSLLAIHKIGLLVISTPEKGLIGVLSERDIVRALHDQGAEALEKQVANYMTRGVWTCGPDDYILNVMKTMNDNKMRHMPVVDGGNVVGVISTTDIMRSFAALPR